MTDPTGWFLRTAMTAAWALSAAAGQASGSATEDGGPVKRVLDARQTGENLLQPGVWRPWQAGFQRDGEWLVCDNGDDRQIQRGASQTVVLDQTRPQPIVASAWSRAENVTGSPGGDYSLYLDLVYADGTPLWGQIAPFATGTHPWQRRQVVILPEKPVRQVTVHLLLRRHGGKAWFRDPQLHQVRAPAGSLLFDGVAVSPQGAPQQGFQVRDVAAGSDFVRIEREALGLKLQCTKTEERGAVFFDVTLADTTGKDRAITLIYAVPVSPDGLRWLEDPRRGEAVERGREYVRASRFRVGANGRLSRYPLGAVARGDEGTALGLDMVHPVFFRVGYNAASGELFLAADMALVPEKPSAHFRFCRFSFDPAWGFRGALVRYYELFPDAFRCRTPRQGLWMPFARISRVEGWEDFGFRFKEGNNETAWDDEHGILTFRYTEPMTWWMRMPPEMPRTLEAALAEAQRLARQGDRRGQALLSSGFRDAAGRTPARLLDTPWCHGAVWSMNSMPGIGGAVTDFKNKWNPAIRDQLYGPGRSGDLDGEYVDSSEGYVTDELDFRRDHFATARTPLIFSPDDHRPAVFRGLIAFEYVRAIAGEAHGMGRLMMANSTPNRLCWLAPWLDVLGTETDWHRGGRWSPMPDAELLYRRALCGPKPFCFLMNTRFEDFPRDLVERYMRRALAYGMFPGFFSHNASQGHYFTRPELYNRDRPLFRKYVPLCRLVAEAGWEPIPQARTDDDRVYVERFGARYLTVFNDSPQSRRVTLRLEGDSPARSRELLSGRPVRWPDGATTLTLAGEDVAVIDLGPVQADGTGPAR